MARALYGFALPLDVYIPALPRYRDTGVLNMTAPEFSALRLSSVLPGNGVLEYLHRRCGEQDVYYFINTRDSDFVGEVFLKGQHRTLWLCDPATGEKQPMGAESVVRHDCLYSRVMLQLPAVSSRFILS